MVSDVLDVVLSSLVSVWVDWVVIFFLDEHPEKKSTKNRVPSTKEKDRRRNTEDGRPVAIEHKDLPTKEVVDRRLWTVD